MLGIYSRGSKNNFSINLKNLVCRIGLRGCQRGGETFISQLNNENIVQLIQNKNPKAAVLQSRGKVFQLKNKNFSFLLFN